MEPQTTPEKTNDNISHLKKPLQSNKDATFDVAKEAIGGNAAELGRGYYRSPNFIGSVAVSFTVHLIHLRYLTLSIGLLSLCLLRISGVGSSGKLSSSNQRRHRTVP
jgi:hypothetical protein